MKDTAIIVLAAGKSSRLGRPKQLLPFHASTLVQRIVHAALKAATGNVVLVTGAHEESVSAVLTGEPITIVHNKEWEEGMSSSIRTGIQASCNGGLAPGNAIICVCDQPFVSPQLLISMVRAKEESGKGIVACAYSGTIGVPVLFDCRYFYNLCHLAAHEGAKHLLSRYKEDVGTIAFPDGDKDIDTEDDYTRLLEG